MTQIYFSPSIKFSHFECITRLILYIYAKAGHTSNEHFECGGFVTIIILENALYKHRQLIKDMDWKRLTYCKQDTNVDASINISNLVCHKLSVPPECFYGNLFHIFCQSKKTQELNFGFRLCSF